MGDITKEQAESIKKDIDVLHEAYLNDSTEFKNKKAKFVKAAKKNLAVIQQWLENPPKEYTGNEYAWLKTMQSEIVPRGFQIITKEVQDQFDKIREAIISRRDKYADNSQWFSTFTSEEKEALEDAKTYSEQYDDINAS